jgi:hydroxymethylcytosylglucuronate/cytosylglucuronate synthase
MPTPHSSPRGEKPRLLAAVCDFGWGSLGKLRLILDKLPATEVTLFGDPGFNAVVSRLLAPQHEFGDRQREECAVALVINDPVAADRIAALSVPVVYVDSLPYLWASESEVPQRRGVVRYCAQKYPAGRLPLSSPLRDWPELRWIDPIVPSAKGHRGGQGIVVNVGGLHSDLGEASADAYLAMVLIPLVKMLNATGRRVSAICGNLGQEVCTRLAALMPECPAIGAQTPYDFEQTLRNADLLITSPGSTTILQAASIRLPTLLLPPQNLSQMMNAGLYADRLAGVMQWPVSVIDREAVEGLRPKGEEVVLVYIYGAIVRAAALASLRAEVADAIEGSLAQAPRGGVLSQSVAELGSNGAGQVAQVLKQLLLAPIPRTAPR